MKQLTWIGGEAPLKAIKSLLLGTGDPSQHMQKQSGSGMIAAELGIEPDQRHKAAPEAEPVSPTGALWDASKAGWPIYVTVGFL